MADWKFSFSIVTEGSGRWLMMMIISCRTNYPHNLVFGIDTGNNSSLLVLVCPVVAVGPECGLLRWWHRSSAGALLWPQQNKQSSSCKHRAVHRSYVNSETMIAWAQLSSSNNGNNRCRQQVGVLCYWPVRRFKASSTHLYGIFNINYQRQAGHSHHFVVLLSCLVLSCCLVLSEYQKVNKDDWLTANMTFSVFWAGFECCW